MNSEKLNIILDLDNTILSAIPLEEFPWSEDNKEKSTNFTIHNMEDYYIVFERPYLQEFLDYIFEHFNVSIWSAASKNYVLFIIDKIIIGNKKNRKLNYIFFSYHCSLSKKLCNGGLKQLNMIWDIFRLDGFNKSNTFIVDDLEKVKKIQPCNCYNIKPFEFLDSGSENDKELKKLMKHLETLDLNGKCLIKQ